MNPLVTLVIGVAVVLGLILVLRLNAFFPLITAAVVVSLLAPGATSEKIPRVAEAFGVTAGKIGIPIAMAAVIGSCLLASGAADRIVQASLELVGEKRSATALASSGFVLSIPVFFDTVFYLMVPLARSLYCRTRRNYLKYLLAVGSGAAIAHTLIPPTPGPLLMADQLGVDLGLMMLIGVAVGIPTLLVGLALASWLDSKIRLENLPSIIPDASNTDECQTEHKPPGLFLSALPILLPVILITSRTILDRMAVHSHRDDPIRQATTLASVFGNANIALLLAAAAAILVYVVNCRPSRIEFSECMEKSLMSAGVIILITAAGGAFGAMLQAAQISDSIESAFSVGEASGFALLWLAFGVSSLLKISQGSSTVAMITASGMMAAMIEGQTLVYNPVYLALAISCGSLCGVWMNDSGFWIFCRMGGLTETEALKSWTPTLALTGATGMLVTSGLSVVLPLSEVAVP